MGAFKDGPMSQHYQPAFALPEIKSMGSQLLYMSLHSSAILCHAVAKTRHRDGVRPCGFVALMTTLVIMPCHEL